jgi:hypothetical protein
MPCNTAEAMSGTRNPCLLADIALACIAVVIAQHLHSKAKWPLWLLWVNLRELQIKLACKTIDIAKISTAW